MTTIEGGGIALLPGQARQVTGGGFDAHELGTRDITGGSYSLIETRAGADEGALAQIAARYSMEIVGPVPHGYLAKEDAS